MRGKKHHRKAAPLGLRKKETKQAVEVVGRRSGGVGFTQARDAGGKGGWGAVLPNASATGPNQH